MKKHVSLMLLCLTCVWPVIASDSKTEAQHRQAAAQAIDALITDGTFAEAASGWEGDAPAMIKDMTDADADWRNAFPATESIFVFYASEEGIALRKANPIAQAGCIANPVLQAFSILDDMDKGLKETHALIIDDSLLTHMNSIECGDLPRNRLVRWLVSVHVLEIAAAQGGDFSEDLRNLGTTELQEQVKNALHLMALPHAKRKILGAMEAIIASYHPEGLKAATTADDEAALTAALAALLRVGGASGDSEE